MAELNLSPLGRFEKILLATDGSNYSAGAERVAIDMALKSGAQLYAMTAVIRGTDLGWLGPQADDKMEREAAKNLDSVKEAATKAGISCTEIIGTGDDPYKVIVKQSKEMSADMIVMGRRGRRGLARLMLGDATAKVIGYAPCSVMVVPEECGMWDNVMIATDGSRSSDAAAVTAAQLAKCCGVPLTVLSVKVPTHSERRQEEAQPIVDRVVGYATGEGITADGVVTEGLADEAILQVAEQRGINLIVLGSFGRTGVGRMLFGSKAERVINYAKSPVLIVRGA